MANSTVMPLPIILLLVGFFALVVAIAIVVTIATNRSYRPIAQERALAERLGPDGLRVKGTVSAWTRHPGGSDVTTAVRLRVRFPLHGTTHEVELVTSIDRELLSGFTPGSTIHLLVDPEAPDQVAVDRRASVVNLPRSW